MSIETYETIVAWLVVITHYSIGASKLYLVKLMTRNRHRNRVDQAVIRNQIALAIMALLWGTLVLVLRLQPRFYVETREFWISALLISSIISLPSIVGLIRAVRRERYQNGHRP